MLQDLHLHSTYSDGALTPSQIIIAAGKSGLKLLSLTDHDTMDGAEECIEAGAANNIKVLPGIEISSYFEGEVHILGYNITHSEKIADALETLKNKRDARNGEIIKKLNNLGYKITMEEIYDNEEGTVGRYKIAKVLKSKKYVANESEAFEKLLAKGRPAHVSSNRFTPAEAVELIVECGGIPVLAHPKLVSFYPDLEVYIKTLISAGLKGIECYYPAHTKNDVRELITLCNKHKLIKTGGSDFHSEHSVCPIGGLKWGMDSYTAEVLGIEDIKQSD